MPRRPFWPSLLLVLCSAFLIPTSTVHGQAAHRDILRAKFARDLQRIADGYTGVLGVASIDLSDSSNQAMVGVNKDMVFPQASAIKIPILIELYRRGDAEPGLLRSRHTLTSATRTGGSGVMGFFADGASEIANEDLAVLMITLSDNTATNFLIDVVGMEAVNRTMAGMGLRETKLQRKMIRPDAQARGEENLSTPAEAATVMARLSRCALPLSRAGCARVRQVLELPKSESVRATVPDSIRVASKPGGMEAVATSWALVDFPGRPFALAVMTNYGDTEAGGAAIREIARLALDYYGKLARSTPYGARVPLAVIERERSVRP